MAVQDIRYNYADYDGDGDDEEGIYYEVQDMLAALQAAMLTYSSETVGTAIGYNPGRYPYFFVDANGDGELSADEADAYSTWTPRLLRAAYNFQYVSKDPGGFVHNGPYVMQVLYDSIEDLGGDVSAMERPEVE